MLRFIPDGLNEEVLESVNAAMAKQKIVNITMILDAIVRRHILKGWACKGLEELILNVALQQGCAIEFGRFWQGDFVPAGYTVLEIDLIPEQQKLM